MGRDHQRDAEALGEGERPTEVEPGEEGEHLAQRRTLRLPQPTGEIEGGPRGEEQGGTLAPAVGGGQEKDARPAHRGVRADAATVTGPSNPSPLRSWGI